MSLLKNVKSKWKIAKLKERVEQESSPSSVGELARFYIQCGDEDAAYALITEYSKIYPESEILKQLRNYLVKRKVNDKVRETLLALQKESNPESYLSIIETYRQHHDLSTAMEYCRRFVADYPNCVLAHRLMGDLRFDRFSQDFSAKDGRAAEEAFKRALSIDPKDTTTCIALARLYFCCRLTGRSRALLLKVLEISPGDLEAKNLMNIMSGMKQDDEDPDFRFTEIEDRQGFYHSWDPEASWSAVESSQEVDGVEALRTQLESTLDLEGLDAAAFIGPGDTRIEVGTREDEASDKNARHSFSDFVIRVEEAARVASLRMDLGAFEKGVVEGSKGELLLRELRGGTAAFRFVERGRIPKVYSDLRDQIEEMATTIGKIHD
ncbi:MAG: hypothetical protein KJ645_07305 [Planctomycetes bacterium]|nr:hypothetical protein [Planctomycetota bacterium]